VIAPDPSALAAALAPLRDALLADARAETARLLATAEADAAAELAATQARADATLAEARAEGEADAVAVLTGDRARANRRARATVLRARSDAYQALRAGSQAAMRDLRRGAEYPRLLDRLAAVARAELGPSATFVEDASGGVLAEAEGRRLDYSLTGFADRAVDALGSDLERLWSP
jgi:hypothetical protein